MEEKIRTSIDSTNENDVIVITDVEVIEVNEAREVKVVSNTEKEIAIQPYSFPIDNHRAELPMFLNTTYSKAKIDSIDLDIHPSLRQLKNINSIISSNEIERKVFENKKNNLNRKLFMYNVGRLPRQFEQDVLNALTLLFIRRNAPFIYEEGNKYNVTEDKVFFTFYEVCMVLKVPANGFYINKIKESIQILKTTQYFSFDDGVFYDKAKNSYVVSREKGISWIADYEFLSSKSIKNMKEKDLNWVQFGNFAIHNLEYGYFNYLKNADVFFELSSGLAREVYSYIDKNMCDSNGKKLRYIKRFFDVLQFKFGLEYKYPSELKRRLNKILDEFIKKGLIVDYFYGDEVIINGKKEGCLYICSVNREKVILDLERSHKLKLQQIGFFTENNKDESRRDYLKIPNKPLVEELIGFGMEENISHELVKKYEKWHIIKYILWLNKQIYSGKDIPSKPGLLRFAIEKPYPIQAGYEEIIEFVSQQKKQEETNNLSLEDRVKVAYDEYINKAIEDFKTEEKDIFTIFYEDTLNNMNSNIDKVIQNLKALKQDTVLQEEFKKKQGESQLFKDTLTKDIRMYKNLKSFEDFRIEYIKNNNQKE